jgi:hypothetical protein
MTTGGVATGGGVSDALANGGPADGVARPAERRGAKDPGADS